jgi:predicted nucleotidyltransferase
MVALDAQVRLRALAAAAALGRQGRVRAAYVFGSHAEGRADEWSDIDVAAFMEEIDSWDLWQRAKVIARVQKEVGYDVEPHLLSASHLTSPQPGSFAEYVMEHGIRIGPDESKPEQAR